MGYRDRELVFYAVINVDGRSSGHWADEAQRLLNTRAVRRPVYWAAIPPRPNFTLKLVRPGFGPAAELPASSPARWRHAGCRSRRAASA